jgi:hypothetical protein
VKHFDSQFKNSDYTEFAMSYQELKSCYRSLIDVILNALLEVTDNLDDFSFISNELFYDYIRPVLDGECASTNVKRLYSNIESALKIHLVKLMKRVPIESSSNVDNSDELTVVQKYLIMACFIASYNEAKYDSKFFGKSNGKRVRKKSGKATFEVKSLQLGPKTFPADRALPIFYHILEEPIDSCIDIYVQFVDLISQGYLTKTSGNALDKNFSSGLKCKCNVRYLQAKKIARSVDVELDRYLVHSK